MKKRTKFLTMLLSALMAAFLLTGCKSTTITKEDSGKMFYNIAIHQDDSKLKDLLGDNASDFNSLLSEQVDDAKESAKKTLSDSNLNLSEDEVNKYIDAILASLKAQECKNVTVDTENDDRAILKLEVTTIDLKTIATDLSKELQEELQNKIISGSYSYSNMKELQNQFMKDYIAALTDKLNNYGVGTKTDTLTYSFEKKEFKDGLSKVELWVPENCNQFGKELGSLTMGK